MDLRGITEFLRDFMWYIIAVIVLILIFTFVIAFQTVAGNSMNPTLKDGQIVLVSRLAYRFHSVKRNEIVVLNKNSKSYVKRVIGLPGEKIDYLDGVLYVDDKPYKETYLDDDVLTYNFTFEDVCSKEDCPDGKIPEGKYMVMGDNRKESEDSRKKEFGLVSKSEIKGKVFFSLWPLGGV